MRPRDAVTGFDIESQRGETISNIGGDQTIYYGNGSRGSQAAKIDGALADGGREWTLEDVQAPAHLRLYRAIARDHYVLDAHDRRVLVTV